MANIYDVGDVVRCSLAVTNAAGTAVDPTALTFTLRTPALSATYTYGVDGALVKDATGAYHYDVTPTLAGQHRYRWAATGTNAGAEPGQFDVRVTQVSL